MEKSKIPGSTAWIAAVDGAGSGWSQERHPNLPCGQRDPDTWAKFATLPRPRELDWKQSSQGSNQVACYLLYHSTGSRNIYLLNYWKEKKRKTKNFHLVQSPHGCSSQGRVRHSQELELSLALPCEYLGCQGLPWLPFQVHWQEAGLEATS